MSGFGRGGKGGYGRGGGSSGSIAALRRGMPPKKNQLPGKSSSGSAAAPSRGADSAVEESFQLACAPQGSSQFAMMIKLTPELLDDLRRVEAEGGTSSIAWKFTPTGTLLFKVGQEEFKLSSAPEQGELDIYEEQRGGEDGQGMLVAAGSAWRKLAVMRTLSATEKDKMKKRSVEAQQQLKSRKAIVLDSNTMRAAEPPGSEAHGRRPPVKSKKEPPMKKRKVAPAVPPAKSKPPPAHSVPVPPKDKNGAATTSVLSEPPVVAAAPSPPSVDAQPPQVPVEKLTVVEEIIVGSSPQNKPVNKEKAPGVTTPPEVLVKPTSASGTLTSNELRNSIIVLLTDNPRGLPIKSLEKVLGDAVQQPRRKNIEKILKSIASYHAPGKYLLKPGVKAETGNHPLRPSPSPGSCSLPEAVAVDSPDSPARAADSKGGDSVKLNQEVTAWEKDQAPGVEVERIDIGEENQSPFKSPAVEQKSEAEPVQNPDGDMIMTDAARPVEEVIVPKVVGSSGSGSSSSGSDSESDSESDSSSGSGTSGSGSGSDSSSSSSDEDEEVDIVSEDENHKPKIKAEKKSSKHKPKADAERPMSEDVHRESEEIDIGDADDSGKQLDALVDRITETIPLEVDVVSCGGGSPSPDATDLKPDDRQHPTEAEAREDPVKLSRDENHRSASQFVQGSVSKNDNDKFKPDPKSPQIMREESEFQKRSYEQPPVLRGMNQVSKHKSARTQPDGRRNEADKHVVADAFFEPPASQEFSERLTKDDARISSGKKKSKWQMKESDEARSEAGRRKIDDRGEFRVPDSDIKGGSDLELGEFREPTPEPVLRPKIDAHKSRPEVEKEKVVVQRAPPASSEKKSADTGTTRKPAEENALQKSRPKKAASQPEIAAAAAAAKVMPEKSATIPVEVSQPRVKAGMKKNSSAEAKSKDSSGDSIQSKGTEFFAAYERNAPELRGPIKSYEQYLDYCREYREKYPVYCQLNSSLEFDRENFESLHRDVELAKSSSDKSRLTNVYKKVKLDYRHCRKRFKRMSKTFSVLHDELRLIKERCKDYARQG